MSPDLLVELRRALGRQAPPATITQEPYDGDPRHLERLVRLKPDELPEPNDLWDYMQDLRYTKIQTPLLNYLLPLCLYAWREHLRGIQKYGAFVEHFYPVVADRHVFDTHLTPKHTAAVSEFMRNSILEEIDDQRGLNYSGMNARPYRWFRALATHGVLLGDVDSMWMSWWSLGTTGRAVAALQYVSVLMYPDERNPVFSAWTREEGGGAPCLWEYAGHLYSHRWLDVNVEFLRRTLTVTAVIDVLTRAAEELKGEPELETASRMLADIPMRSEMLAARCAQLPTLLATRQEPSTLLAWSS